MTISEVSWMVIYLHWNLKKYLFLNNKLVSGIESIVRYKVEIVPSSLPQPVYMIVVYGEMYINGVTSRKGEYVKMQETTDTFDINFLKPTTLLLINL